MKNLFNLGVLFLGAFLGAFSAFLLQFILARNVTPEILGNYSSILFLTTTISPLCGFGISQYLLRIFGQYGSHGFLWVSPSLKFVIFSTTIVILVLVGIAILGYKEPYLKYAALSMSFIALSELVLGITSTVLQLEEKYQKLAIWQLSQNLFRLISILVLIYITPLPVNENSIAFCYAIVAVIVCAIGIKPIIKLSNKIIKLAGHSKKVVVEQNNILMPSILSVFKEALPFGCAALFYSIYYQLGVVFVRYYVDAENAGYYSIAFTILTAAMVLPGVIYQKYLIPKLHRWAYHDRAKFYQVYCQGNYAMLCLGLLTCGVIWWLSPIAIPLIFGESYLPSVPITQLLSLNIPVTYLASNIGAMLVTGEHMLTKVKFMGGIAILSVLLNGIFTPIFKINGVIVITIICNFILLGMYYIKAKKSVFIIEQC